MMKERLLRPSPAETLGHRLNAVRMLWLALALVGASLHGRAQTASPPMTPSAIVSSEKDHALTLVDLTSLNVTATIPTCKRPRHLRLLPGAQVIVACGDSGQADVIDLVKRQSVKRVPLGDDPELFDLSADGKTLYVSNEEDAKVGIIDLGSGRRVGEIAVGEEPEGVQLSADGRILYVTSEVASVVHVVDVASRKVVKDIPVGKRPRRFALTPDGRELWVSHELDASVSVIDTRRQAVVATVRFELKGARAQDITPVGMTLAPDGKTLYVALGNANHVAFVDVSARKVRQMVLVGKRAWSVATDRDGARLFVVNGLSDDLTVVDVASAKATRTVKVGRVPHSVVVLEPGR